MKNFIQIVLSNREKFKYVSLTYNDINKIQKVVLDSLELKNINELRDRYEGMDFYNNFLLKILPIIALEKFLKVELINWESLDPKNLESKIYVGNEEVDIIVSEYGELPAINPVSSTPAIICIKKDNRDIWICGFADIETLNSFQSNNQYLGLVSKKREVLSSFTGFKNLLQFSSIDDLIKLLNNNKIEKD